MALTKSGQERKAPIRKTAEEKAALRVGRGERALKNAQKRVERAQKRVDASAAALATIEADKADLVFAQDAVESAQSYLDRLQGNVAVEGGDLDDDLGDEGDEGDDLGDNGI
jgi:hypothetical protein